MTTIKAKNDTIKEIVEDEVKRLGNSADLNHIDVSVSKFKGDIPKWATFLKTTSLMRAFGQMTLLRNGKTETTGKVFLQII